MKNVTLHRSIGPAIHGVIDYAMVIILVIGPSVSGFTGRQATFCYLLATVHLVLFVSEHSVQVPLSIPAIWHAGVPAAHSLSAAQARHR